MENQRLFLWMAFAFVLFLIYQAWMKDYRAPPAAPPEAAPPALDASSATSPPDELPALPSDPTVVPQPPEAAEVAAPTAGRRLTVLTDVLELEIDTLGGDLLRLVLPRYPVQKDQPDVPVRLLNDSPAELFLLQSGLRSLDGAPEPNHRELFQSSQDRYELAPGERTLEVALQWRSGTGLSAVKRYIFERGSYRVRVTQELRNDTASPWAGTPYLQLKRRHVPVDRSFQDVDSYSFRGPVFYDGRKYSKIDVDDLAEEPLAATTRGGWFASIQHHFLAAAIPPADIDVVYSGRVQAPGETYLLTAIGSQAVAVAPGEAATFEHSFFVGPKLQDQLEQTAKGLVLTVDYGFLTLIAQPLYWVLDKLHGVTGNWGWSIVLLTLLIKLAFYKLSETSGHSMAKMRKLQPRMKALQERYKDDRQALSRAMMEMYKREGANPMAGCLPILVQMPVFIALYWVLLESVELRQAPFALWINDLSSRDPYFILPLLMGVTMFVQQKLNPAPPDPVQAKVMMVLPLVFTVFFAFFPAGLVLYWFVNNLLSILQQWRINTVVERKHS